MYSLLLALIYVAFISLGLPDSLLGSGWPTIHADLHVPVSYMGIVSMVISGGTIVSSLLSDKLTRKLGTRIVTVVSVLLTAIALFGFSFATKFWMLIVFAVPYGLGAGASHMTIRSSPWRGCNSTGTRPSDPSRSGRLWRRLWPSGRA